jgi:hypothetical protein
MKKWLLFRAPWIPLLRLLAWPYNQLCQAQMQFMGITYLTCTEETMSEPGDEIAPIKYRKKPVVIDAIRWTGDNLREVIDFTGLHPSADKWTWEEYEAVVREKGLKIFSLEGSKYIVTNGDYVIKGVKGEFYARKPDIFWMTYERAS